WWAAKTWPTLPKNMNRNRRSPVPARPTCLTRRQALGGLSFGALGLGLPELFRLQAEAAERRPARAKACIFIFLNGGASHIDMWDMKPEAPVEVRGEF